MPQVEWVTCSLTWELRRDLRCRLRMDLYVNKITSSDISQFTLKYEKSSLGTSNNCEGNKGEGPEAKSIHEILLFKMKGSSGCKIKLVIISTRTHFWTVILNPTKHRTFRFVCIDPLHFHPSPFSLYFSSIHDPNPQALIKATSYCLQPRSHWTFKEQFVAVLLFNMINWNFERQFKYFSVANCTTN